jgi:hypothetical protein
VHTGVWWRNQRERDRLEDPTIDGRTTLKWIFKKWDGGREVDRCGSGSGQAAGSCECGNETFGFHKVWGI